jgi:hypothetical protein
VLYKRSGGKNGKHCAVEATSNIVAISRMGLQLFEHIGTQGQQF